ncbi:MAG TPA: protein kinase [Thermoanaerobaculia bacterium]|nr:protein kinase [Thermoanaerobaculia bacterium]
MTLVAGTKLGPYEILASIGAGGMGEVYRAKDPRLGRDVAIKVLPASFSQDAERLRRFEQEAKAAGILNHPNLTAVHDVGTHEGAPYVVQELLEGETLRSVLAGGKLSGRRAVDYALQIVHGLSAAHEKGIVHRDLKPENIFVTNDGRVKILDFGLAKLTHTEERGQATNLPTATAGTEPGVVLGTLGYMSPEQVRGKSADQRSDIFSFGAILYEMLSGSRAFHGDSAADTMSAILKEDPPDLSVTNQSISPGLERIVRHCLEKNPEQRFHSAHDLAFDLETLSGVSAAVRPTVPAPAAGERRWLLPAGAALLAVAALAAGYVLGHRKASDTKPSHVAYSQLTFRQEPIFNARFSPDGKTVVYSAAPSGNAPEIFSLRPDYPGTAPTGRPGMTLLSISSRGELAVLTRPRYIRHSVFFGTLARMPLEGGAPREIVDGVTEADWNPDGSDLAVIREVNGKIRLEFPLGHVLAETGGYFSNPRFSRKGDRIAFFDHPQRFDDRGSVAVVDLSGKRTTLSQGYWGEEGLAWSADGQEVMFSAGTAYNNFEVYAVNLSGERRTALQSAGGLTLLDVSPDGRWIASRDDLWKETPVLGPGQAQERNLAWLDLSYVVALTPDGKTLLFTEESGSMGSNYATCIRQTDGSPVVRLGEGSAVAISADGKWVLSNVPTDPQQLVLYPTGAGQPRKLERGGIVSYESAAIFPDGRRVLACGHEAGHGTRCYVQNVEGGAPRPVTPEGTSGAIVSPDGRQILVEESEKGLMLYPAEGGAGRPVPGSSGEDSVIQWTADGKSLLVTTFFDVPAHVVRLDLATGRREPYSTVGPTSLTGAVRLDGIVFSEDGRSHAYTVRRMSSHLFLVSGSR